MAKSKVIEVKGIHVTVLIGESEDYVSLTDIARYKDSSNTDDIIKNWLRNRNTIELLGLWEHIADLRKSGFWSSKLSTWRNKR